jgi:hypothetical protein
MPTDQQVFTNAFSLANFYGKKNERNLPIGVPSKASSKRLSYNLNVPGLV